MKAIFLTGFALTAFAFNSILCRLALGTDAIDPAAFTAIRLLSGAVALVVVSFAAGLFQNKKAKTRQNGNWISSIFLFIYAAAFSFAYTSLSTATGALILFGVVQITMIAIAVASGERPGVLEYAGIIIAFLGLVYLVLPGLRSPPIGASIAMAAAGVAWGFYTIRGKGSEDPLGDTAGNFLKTIPFAVLLGAISYGFQNLSWRGILLAVLSGAVASGVGYAVWYAALQFHTSARAAILQLAVPLIAAIGGIILIGESLTVRFAFASLFILGGICMSILTRR